MSKIVCLIAIGMSYMLIASSTDECMHSYDIEDGYNLNTVAIDAVL